MSIPLPIENLGFDGNHLSLDFINTIHNRYATELSDYLTDQATWVVWLRRKNLSETPLKGDYLFDLNEIRHLRELLYRLFTSIIKQEKPLKRDISDFNRQLISLRRATEFGIKYDHPLEIIQVDKKNLNSYLLLIVAQAHKLMLSDEINRVKECDNCGWLFLDTSKSNKRRWCNMKTCGNEVKARRHYQKVKERRNNDD